MKNYAIILIASLMLATFINFANAEPARKPVHWTVGDRWEIDTTLFSRGWMLNFSDPKMEQEKEEDKVLSRYIVTVDITGEVSLEGVDCWQIDFTPDNQAPPGVREIKYRVLVSKQYGSMKKISYLSGPNIGNPELKQVDGITFLKNAPYGFPIEMIPWKLHVGTDDKKSSRQKVSATLKEIDINDEKWIEVEVKEHQNLPLSSVRQKWDAKHQWWEEYQKYNRGHRELIAKLKKT